jgi:hypothetical protein
MGASLRLVVSGLLFLCWVNLGAEEAYSQASASPAKDLPVSIGAIDFRVKEFEATPSPIRMLELQIEVVNKSEKMTIPPNAVKIVAIAKVISFSSLSPTQDFSPPAGEVTLTLPLPPRGIHIGILGFSLPPGKLEAISFQIQINPPEGEKKDATFRF